MLSKQALLAAIAVAAFAAGRPMARRLVGVVPGIPAGELGDTTVGAIAAAVAFQVAKRALP